MAISRREFLQTMVVGAAASVSIVPVMAQNSPLYCPILMYHYISAAPEGSSNTLVDLTVPPEAFAQHLDFALGQGFTAITMRTLWAGIKGETTLPEKPIVFSFDDGYWDAYAHAAPLLLQRGMTGIIYVTTSFVDQPGYLTWGQIQEMHNNGIEIGGHSVIHGDMSRQAKEQQRSEIEQSTAAIEAATGVRPTSFAYPFGRHNNITRNLLAEYGYATAVTTSDATVHYYNNPYRMGRVRIRNSTTLQGMVWLLNTKR